MPEEEENDMEWIIAAMNFMTAHWLDLLVIALVSAVLLFAWAKGKKKWVLSTILAIVAEFEQKFGAGTGAIKKQAVLSAVYAKLPLIMKIFITYEKLGQMIEDGVRILKQTLEEAHANLLTYEQEQILAMVENDKPPIEYI